MHKWRQDYPLKQKIKILSDEDGITLVELLAAISILSIVILLAGSIHIFGQKQFIEQAESASQENDLSYAMTVITTDLRKSRANEIEVTKSSVGVKGRYLYQLEGNQLKKGDTILIEGVSVSFNKIYENEKIEGIHLTIKDNNLPKEYETTIYFRGETNDR